MASNFGNYFFTAFFDRFAYDEYVFGPNTMTGSGNYFTFVPANPPDPATWYPNILWAPTTGTIQAQGTIAVDKTVLSPIHHGFLADTFSSPPERYLWSNDGKTSPPIDTPLASGSSYTLSINRDPHSRIFSRFQDQDADDESLFDGTFTPLS